MLASLYLKDFAIAREVEFELGSGMTVISGETGAGKSLLVDALMLLTGARAEASVVREGAQRAEIGAMFALADAPAARAWLDEQELSGDDEADECHLRRSLRADGGSRAWINGRPATLAQLSELGRLLVEIHGQHEHQALLSRSAQLDLLDAFGQHADALAVVAGHARRWRETRQRITALQGGDSAAERIEDIERALSQLDREALDAESLAALFAAHRRQANAAALLDGCTLALARLGDEDGGGVGRALSLAGNELRRLVEHEPRLAELAEALDTLRIQMDDTAAALERIRDDLDLDPARMEELETRLSRLHELSRRHRVPIEQLAAHRATLAEELDALRGADALRETLGHELAAQAADWQAAAAELSRLRAATAQQLGAAVSTLMDELGMAGGRFVAELTAQPEAQTTPDPLGAERVEFLVSANPGQAPRALRKVASGGELSRISLAIEVAALGADSVPTMIFDEVDSGIGGAIAEVVGRKLRALAAQRQVLCVTHLAQVAACGHAHHRVSKTIEDGQTHSRIEHLDAAERIEETARMLGGIDITRETRAHARQMLERSR